MLACRRMVSARAVALTLARYELVGFERFLSNRVKRKRLAAGSPSSVGSENHARQRLPGCSIPEGAPRLTVAPKGCRQELWVLCPVLRRFS